MIPKPQLDDPLAPDPGLAAAVLAGGCFWCTEAVYQQLEGVVSVTPGYAGGAAETANYPAVCTGTTGHAEAVRIVYDPSRISYGTLLEIFFGVAHDPTQLNRQGADVGTQYRSTVFYDSPRQEALARAYIRQLTESNALGAPLATTLEPLEAFYPAEPDHHRFAARHPFQPYIQAVARPKVEKLAEWKKGRPGSPA